MEVWAEGTERQRKAESPVYDEIKERIYTEINEAYAGISHPSS